jgi:DNA-binding transcriptional LysR family regulator
MQVCDWSDIQVFLAIARAGSMSKAGRTTQTDPTTLGRRLRRLEASLHVTLFERSNTGQVLTEAGERLFVVAEAMANAAASISENSTHIEGPTGTVRISVSEGFGSYVISRHIADFAISYPHVQIDLVASSGFLSPSKREADIAVMLSRPNTGPVLARKLSDYCLRLYANPEYLRRNRPVLTMNDLALGHELIGYIPDLLYSPELNYLSEFDPSLVAKIRSSSIIAQHRMVAQGAGIGVLPCFMGDGDPNLVPVFPDRQIRRSFWLVTHKDTQTYSRITACKQWLMQIARSEQRSLNPDP